MDVSPVTYQPVAPGASLAGSVALAGSAGGATSASGQVAQVAPVPNPQTLPSSQSDAGSTTPSSAQLAQAISHVNDTFTQRAQNLYATFGKDASTGISVVKIVDKNTKEIISQIPSKQMLAFAQFLDQSQGKGGQLLDVKA